MTIGRVLRLSLDFLYRLSGAMAAVSLVMILLLVVMQMAARWTGEMFRGGAEYAGYAMAAASFLAFANALNHGSHIRVSILLNAVPEPIHRILEIWCFAVGTAIMWYFVYYGQKFVYWSWKFGERSQGQDGTLLWMPQSLVLFGATVLAICLTDHLFSVLFYGRSRIVRNLADQSHGE
ncbi:Tripartite ATP-independent transporter, DctQ component [Roseovarius lutimaris]|uniref:TRAP transporter small permease protein n=1 Tax=Roseovarius lutimaris TaxID=1005928 RepID=A0A1I5GWM9_9RHOB|nr:TRAP transporter small permease [Roseovarius lutimaris]SFO40464.1 Tripartite ATP-independent transporter, DctQ component [Roseovarius lutimaris]